MSNKKILILGSNGFIGKNLKQNLKKIYNNENYDCIYVSRTVADIKNHDELERVMLKERPNIIIHACGLVGSSLLNKEKNEYDTFNENILITSNILDCANQFKVDKLILFSTYRMFGDDIRENYDETDIGMNKETHIKNNFGYLLSKKMQNIQMELFMKSQNQTKVVCLIMPNIFGENDCFIPNGRIVPSIFYKILNAKEKGENILIDGSPKNQVNLIYVGDIIKMVETFIEQKREEHIGNVIIFNKSGTLEVGELANKIAKIVGYNNSIYFNETTKYNSTNIMKPNLAKMNQVFPGVEFSEIDDLLKKVYLNDILFKKCANQQN